MHLHIDPRVGLRIAIGGLTIDVPVNCTTPTLVMRMIWAGSLITAIYVALIAIHLHLLRQAYGQ